MDEREESREQRNLAVWWFMSELEDAQLDGLIRRHCNDALDGQLGGAELSFRRRLAEEAASPTARPPTSRIGLWFGGRFFAIAGTALAASIAGLLVAPAIFRTPSGPSLPANLPPHVQPPPQLVEKSIPKEGNPPPMVQYVESRTWDGGTVIVNGDKAAPAPARRIIRERLERARWFDPEQGAWIEVLVPRRYIELTPVDPF